MKEIAAYQMEHGKEYYLETIEKNGEKPVRYIGTFNYLPKEGWLLHKVVFYSLTPINKGRYGYPQRNLYIYKDSHKFYLKQKDVIEMKVTNRILQAITGDPSLTYY